MPPFVHDAKRYPPDKLVAIRITAREQFKMSPRNRFDPYRPTPGEALQFTQTRLPVRIQASARPDPGQWKSSMVESVLRSAGASDGDAVPIFGRCVLLVIHIVVFPFCAGVLRPAL